MAIYEGAIGGGNGRITSEVIVDGGTLEVGCQGIGQLILDDIEGQSLKSPLTVKMVVRWNLNLQMLQVMIS